MNAVDFRRFVEEAVQGLTGPSAEDAHFALVEAGPAALPHLVEAYETTRNPDVRASIVQVVAEYRSIDAAPFLEARARENEAQIWKAALDALVTLGGEVALEVLAAAKTVASTEKADWIDEAVQQILDSERRPA